MEQASLFDGLAYFLLPRGDSMEKRKMFIILTQKSYCKKGVKS